VDLLFADDDLLAQLNARHLRRAASTDVLAFEMNEPDCERGGWLLGEIAVSREAAARESAARGLPFEEELARYAVHGFLHLLGCRDGTPPARAAMTGLQERALKAAGFGARS
jgi:probable rRNA maturation factor